MLPYCSRCSSFVCLAAAAFIARHRRESGISKIYLPLRVAEDAPKVRVVAAHSPLAAVDYVEAFLQEHLGELQAHEQRMESGEETEPFLMILSPTRSARFLSHGRSDQRLQQLVDQWVTPKTGHSADYHRVLTYCTVAVHPQDNFAVRKVLRYEQVPDGEVHALIARAMAGDKSLADVVYESEFLRTLELCDEIQAVAVSEEVDADDKAQAISERMLIQDPIHFADELRRDPIGSSYRPEADDEAEAIQTAGSMSAVELMTIFQAKGLSATHVIVLGADDVNMRRLSSLVFFVALTRARASLHLITSLQAGGSAQAHSCVLDIPEEYCEYIAFTRGDGAVSLQSAAAFEEKLSRWQWGISTGSRRGGQR
jgi:hypothetical protein